MTMPIIDIKNLENYLGGEWVHRGVSFSVEPGEIVAVIGASGAGKTTLLRSLLLLQAYTGGQISLFGQDLATASSSGLEKIRKRMGVLFQQSALFSSLTVLENVEFPLKELTHLNKAMQTSLAFFKLLLAGLTLESATKYPAALSGGMLKRAALARALSLDPALLFLDEPTSGLDPSSAFLFDQLILQLREALDLTIVMVSHDLSSLSRIADRVAFLGDGQCLAIAPLSQLKQHPHPLIQAYFRETSV